MVTEIWQRFEAFPLGKKLFSRILSLRVPYTGSIHPEILSLGGGKAVVRMSDRRKLRNHLSSLHAAALMNLCEAATGLALDSALPPDARAILRGFRIEFLAKARGTIEAHAEAPAIASNEKQDLEVLGVARDSAGTEVCRAHALWRVGPKKKG